MKLNPVRIRAAIAFLTVPAIFFFLMQYWALGVLLLTWRDVPMPPWLGYTVFGAAVAAFLFSAPALAALSRSDIQGLLRYLLMGVHVLWFVIGGLFLMALVVRVIYPFYRNW